AFGGSVAVDGDTAVVGADRKNENEGRAYVFARTGTTWTQQTALRPPGQSLANYVGRFVALAGDTIVVGAHSRIGGGVGTLVFTRTGATWTYDMEFMGDVYGAYDWYGHDVASIALSGDTTLVGGAAFSNYAQGAVAVFGRNGKYWGQQNTYLLPADAARPDLLGGAVALSGDTAVVGAVGKNSHGAAYVFARTGTLWTQEAELTAADWAENDSFGAAVAMSGDTAVVGAPWKDGYVGAAYVFRRAGTTWTPEAKLTAADASAGDFFGASVAIVGD